MFSTTKKWFLIYFNCDKSVSVVHSRSIIEVEEVPGGKCTVKEKTKVLTGQVMTYGMFTSVNQLKMKKKMNR